MADLVNLICTFMHVSLRLGLEARGHDVPESDKTVAKLVNSYANEVKEMNRDIIGRLMKRGYRFSVTMDEYTRLGNRKLANINLHLPDGDFLRIGLVRVRGKMPAEVARDVLLKKLSEYCIDLKKDVISHTTDGASVMRKCGRLLDIIHQICHAHGMHLAVCDVLYKRKKSNEAEEESCKEQEEEDEEDDEVENGDWLEETLEHEPELIVYEDVIEKVRKIVRKFRRSTTANDDLQDKIAEVLGKEKALKIDVK